MQSDRAQTDPSAASRLPVRRVLVVDDNPFQRRIVSAMLSRWGYDVVEAGSGVEALSECAATAPDMVISDWMMPGMDGVEFCRAFRQLAREDYGYFILLTSKGEKDHVAEGLNSGADDFLTKPLNPVELRARLRAGERILSMQAQLQDKNRQLAVALSDLQAIQLLIDSDLVEARKLQQSLVRERFRDFGPAQVSLALSPAGHVGGDLVGFIPVGEDCVVLYAIDVAGHGISSALMTARLAGYLSASAPEQNLALTRGAEGAPLARPPAEVAARLNAVVLNDMRVDHFFTLALAICDLTSGEVSLVQAGHPHPLIQHRDGRLTEVGAGGLPIGLLHDASYDEVRFQLAPGDRLLILSDGVTECPGAHGGLLGEDGLKVVLSGLSEVRGPALLDSLIWTLAEINPQPDFPDDISGIMLEIGD
ncbi:SpoIIE family protein phosphatase [Pseudooceanicola sp.]|uniref:PP2C family protein-serine/threonine phosphatase n=1 Tax=Pseudooceanicola sp. TaxID=1914328 RepID=UPI002611E335|nr:SpoIIE family protein phosphatase [Pseudooceanicola sp.]MDF1854971.1 SpoIIE family protein phosphatase [Pseudooceanicola sp.]